VVGVAKFGTGVGENLLADTLPVDILPVVEILLVETLPVVEIRPVLTLPPVLGREIDALLLLAAELAAEYDDLCILLNTGFS